MNVGVVGKTTAGERLAAARRRLWPETKHPEDMAWIKASDIWLSTRSDVSDQEKANSLFTQITWPNHTVSFGRLSFKASGKDIEELLGTSILSSFGPVHVKFQYREDYFGTGQDVWLVTFSANSILAWRYALMSKEDFKTLLPWECKNHNL